MRRILFWSSLLVVVLVTSVAIWLWTADLGLFKPQLERWVSAKTGREFAIDGRFSVDLAKRSIVIAEGVRFGNADWAGPEDMVRVGRAEIHVDFWSLLRRPILIELIEVDDVEASLAGREDGPPNWAIDVGSQPEKKRPDSAGPLVLLKKIDVRDVDIGLVSPQRVRPLHIRVNSLEQVHREDDVLDFVLDAAIDESPVTVAGEAGGWQQLLAAKDIRYRVEGRIDTFEFASAGRIDDLMNLRRPEIRFEARGPHINDLLRALGLDESGEGDIDIAGSLIATVGEPLVLDIAGNLGRLEIEAAGRFSDLQNLEEVDVDLLASGPDLGRLLRLFGVHQVREAPFMIDVNAKRVGPTLVVDRAEMVFGEARFDLEATMPRFPSVDNSRIHLRINGPDIQRFRYLTSLPGQATGAFSIEFELDVNPDGVEVLELNLETSLGKVDAQGKLGDAPGYIGSELQFRVSGGSLATTGSAYGVDHLPDRPFDVSGRAALQKDGIRTTGPLTGTVNEVYVTLEGLFALNSGLVGSLLDFSLRGPDLAVLTGAFGAAQGVPDEAYDLAGMLEVRNDGYRFREVAGTIGTSGVAADGLLVARRGLDGTQFEVSASGPAFEELIDEIGSLEVTPGRYDFSGKIGLHEDRLSFQDLELDRARGKLALDMDLGRPFSRKWMQFDLRARGKDIRTLFAGTERIDIAESPFVFDVQAERHGNAWSFDRVRLDVGDVEISADGDLEFADASSRTQFRFAANVPDLSTVGTIDGHPLRPQSLSWNAGITGGGGELRIDDLTARLGNSDIQGKFHYYAGDVPRVEIDVWSDAIVFAPLMEEREFEYDPEPERPDGRLIPDIAVPFDAMKKLDANVSVEIGELQRDKLFMRDLRIHATLQNGRLDVKDTGFKARSGELAARGTLDPAAGRGSASLELVARDFALGMSDTNLDMAMTGDIDMNLTGNGNDLRALFASAQGMVFVNTRGGRASSNRILHMLYGDLLNEVIATINPFSRTDPYTEFECIVLPTQFDNGVVRAEPHALIGTSRMRIATESEINLGSERLEMSVRTTSRGGLGISAGELLNPFVRIKGTLARPRLAVDEQGVLITGGAAVATGGLSILAKGLWDRMKRSDDPCTVTAEEGRQQLAQRFPDLALPE